MHSKSDIKEWMKENGKTCKWLADQCGVSIHTVYGWMSVRREIPSKSLVRIRELMGEAAPSLGVVKGVKAGSLKALQLENTILRAYIALRLKPGEALDLDEWVRSSGGNK
ncbi:hypothetical protein [Akkermansia sp.]|uniref:hypothetical protein n=1 Tax=Akkermansia sp. TaxID=1872421 RepID=UPI003A8EAF3A